MDGMINGMATATTPTTQPTVYELGSRRDSAPGRLTRLTTAALLGRVRPRSPLEVFEPHSARTARLLLRPLRETDRPEYLRVVRLSREALEVHCPLHRRGESDAALFERQLALSDRAVESGLACRRIALDSSGRIVGAFNINDIRRGGLEHCGELTFWISADASGRGYCTEGLQETIDHALGERWVEEAAVTEGSARAARRGLGLHSLFALIAPSNIASARVARKVGLRLEPRGAYIEIILHGRPEPHDLWSIRAAGVPIDEASPPTPFAALSEASRSGLLGLIGVEDGLLPFAGGAVV